MTTRGGIPNTLDIVFSIMTVVLVVEAARRVMGWMLPILGLIFLSYPFVSHFDWMPDRLLTRPYTFSDIFGQMYLKTEGLYSSAIGASVTFIFLFILFGAFWRNREWENYSMIWPWHLPVISKVGQPKLR